MKNRLQSLVDYCLLLPGWWLTMTYYSRCTSHNDVIVAAQTIWKKKDTWKREQINHQFNNNIIIHWDILTRFVWSKYCQFSLYLCKTKEISKINIINQCIVWRRTFFSCSHSLSPFFFSDKHIVYVLFTLIFGTTNFVNSHCRRHSGARPHFTWRT